MIARTLAALALLTALPLHAEPPPVAAFFDTPSFTGAALSPSGKYLAVRVGVNGGREQLAVVDLADNKINVVAQFSDADVGNFMWVNDKRLVFDSHDRTAAAGDSWRSWPGLWGVNRDGGSFRRLVDPSNSWLRNGETADLLPFNTLLLKQRTAQDSDYVYALHPTYGGDQVEHEDLVRVNTLSAQEQLVEAPGKVIEWMLDAHGEPRLAVGQDKGTIRLWYRDPAQHDSWRTLLTYDAYTGDAIEPVGFAPDGSLYVSTHRGSDKTALYKLNLATGQPYPAPVLKIDQFDFAGRLVTANGKLAGIDYLGDSASTAWLDPAHKALQDSVDALLPNTTNHISLPARPETPWVLVVADSDRQPPVYLLYNAETKKLNKVGEARPAIRPKEMGKRAFVHVKARDGLEFPAWLTLPAGRDPKKLPMVVLVHGGPYVRGGAWQWYAESQFLASRGYVVLEPEFRGSTGYGSHLFTSGWKQWGLKMQDDVADATRWAIAQGYADPARVCIAGASYGGYATLMGLVNDPQLYKCGVDWVGVTDIELLFTGHWTHADDMSDVFRTYGAPTLIGDPKDNPTLFAATSPLKQAARITQPLLLAYGGADRRVPIYHGKQFLAAVSPGNKNVEWVEYENEGHGWALAKNRIDFWTRVERFLDRNIGH